MNILIGWMLGVLSSFGMGLLLLWGIAREEDRRNDPPTKEEWKVM